MLWRTVETIERVKRTPPPPEERARLIFERLAPRGPAIVPEDLEKRLLMGRDDAQARELKRFVEEQRQAQAGLRVPPPVEPEPEPAPVLGHWEYQRVPGSFGKASFRRRWVPHELGEEDRRRSA
jgi:hypothetical protein